MSKNTRQVARDVGTKWGGKLHKNWPLDSEGWYEREQQPRCYGSIVARQKKIVKKMMHATPTVEQQNIPCWMQHRGAGKMVLWNYWSSKGRFLYIETVMDLIIESEDYWQNI